MSWCSPEYLVNLACTPDFKNVAEIICEFDFIIFSFYTLFPILKSTQNHISCSGQIKFVVVQHDIRHYGSITDIKRTKKEQNPIFCAMCPTKDFQNKVQKSYVLFGFFVSVTLGLKIEKTHQLCAKLQGSVIIHYTGLTCLIISIFLPILNTHFCANFLKWQLWWGFYFFFLKSGLRRRLFQVSFSFRYSLSIFQEFSKLWLV